MSGLTAAVSKAITDLTTKNIINPITTVLADLKTVVGSAASILNELTRAIAGGLQSVISIVTNVTSLVPNAANLVVPIENVGTSLIELVQTVNVIAETATNLINFGEVNAIVDGIVAGCIDAVFTLLEKTISVVTSLAASPTTTAAKAIASIQVVLQTILKIVVEILTSVQGFLTQITKTASPVLTDAITAINQTLSGVNKIVAQLSSDSSAAIKEMFASLDKMAGQLSTALLNIINAASESLAVAVANVSVLIGSLSGATSSISSLKIDDALQRILSDVAAVLHGAFSNIEAAINVVVTYVPTVIGVTHDVSVVSNTIGEVLSIISSLTAESCRDAGSDNGIADVLNDAVSKLIASAQAVVASILSISDGDLGAEVAFILEQIACAIIAIIQCVVAAVTGLLDGIVASIDNIADKLSSIISGALNGIISCINGSGVDKILNGLSKSVSALAGNLGASLADPATAVLGSSFAVSGALSGSLDGITGVLCSILNATVGKISEVVDKLNGSEAVTDGIVGPVTGVNGRAAAAFSLLAINFTAILQTLSGILLAASNIGMVNLT